MDYDDAHPAAWGLALAIIFAFFCLFLYNELQKAKEDSKWLCNELEVQEYMQEGDCLGVLQDIGQYRREIDAEFYEGRGY